MKYWVSVHYNFICVSSLSKCVIRFCIMQNTFKNLCRILFSFLKFCAEHGKLYLWTLRSCDYRLAH